VNPEDLAWHSGVIANPNCSTIQMVVALKPLDELAEITRVVVSTYQAASGAGQAAMDELYSQSGEFLRGQELHVENFAHRIAFNCIPQIDVFMDDRSTKEEWKMVVETRKIMHGARAPVPFRVDQRRIRVSRIPWRRDRDARERTRSHARRRHRR
jgi:aspartate-semialdehyde dehydrogenase